MQSVCTDSSVYVTRGQNWLVQRYCTFEFNTMHAAGKAFSILSLSSLISCICKNVNSSPVVWRKQFHTSVKYISVHSKGKQYIFLIRKKKKKEREQQRPLVRNLCFCVSFSFFFFLLLKGEKKISFFSFWKSPLTVHNSLVPYK